MRDRPTIKSRTATSVTYKRSAAIDLVNGDVNARIYANAGLVKATSPSGIPPYALVLAW